MSKIKRNFHSCFELEYLDLSNFDTSNVESMVRMFFQCKTLKEIKGLNNFITNKVIDMREMFSFCLEVKYLDLSTFDFTNVKNMVKMFAGCIKLECLKPSHSLMNLLCNTGMVKYFSQKFNLIKK